MPQDRKGPAQEDLAKKLNDALGEISPLEAEAPGVYYLTVHGHGEIYLVEKTSPIISDDVKAYGKQFPDFPNLLFYPSKEVKGGSKLVAYEVEKYDTLQKHPEHDSKSLRAVALYAAEFHPEFFGSFPVPIYTPWGSTIRHRRMENGIYWLETDCCQEVLAICYPIWDAELSEKAVRLGAAAEYDQAHDINATLGYLFFQKTDACVPIFELLKTRQDLPLAKRIHIPALMNAIWQDHPGYVLSCNLKEQAGTNDLVHWLLMQIGIETESNISLGNVITLFPDSGVDYLRF